MSREKFSKVYIKENPPHDDAIPGPGAYNVKKQAIEMNNASFTMRPNTSMGSMFNDPTSSYPGPGQYNAMKAIENRNGFYVYSRYKSPGNAVISRKGQRFDLSRERTAAEIPGPGMYKQGVSNPRMRNSKFIVFTRAERNIQMEPSKTRRQTPGPGTYRLTSDFSGYDPNEGTRSASHFMSKRAGLRSAGR